MGNDTEAKKKWSEEKKRKIFQMKLENKKCSCGNNEQNREKGC